MTTDDGRVDGYLGWAEEFRDSPVPTPALRPGPIPTLAPRPRLCLPTQPPTHPQRGCSTGSACVRFQEMCFRRKRSGFCFLRFRPLVPPVEAVRTEKTPRGGHPKPPARPLPLSLIRVWKRVGDERISNHFAMERDCACSRGMPLDREGPVHPLGVL